MSRVYVGLDLGSSFFQQAVMDGEGIIGRRRRLATSATNLTKAFSDLGEEGDDWELEVQSGLIRATVLE